MKPAKSSTTAGVLGILLGSFGAHDWYLGKKKPAIIHLCLVVASLILVAIGALLGGNFSAIRGDLMGFAWSLYIGMLGFLVALGNAVWGLVAGILLLAGGDAALAAKGYNTSPTPSTPKQKLTLSLWLGGGAFALILLICLLVALLLHTDYGASYRLARNLKSQLSDLVQGYGCEQAISSVNLTRVNASTYADYTKSCETLLTNTDDLLRQIRRTTAYRNNSDFRDSFENFEDLYSEQIPNLRVASSSLDLYTSWHNFVLRSESLTPASSDSDFTAAADLLKSTGHETLVRYAEGWLEKSLAYAHASEAYRNYQSDDPSERSRLRNALTARDSERRFWIAENYPDLEQLTELDFSNFHRIYTAFQIFYDLATTLYEDNYDSGSGDCSEAYGFVHCL